MANPDHEKEPRDYVLGLAFDERRKNIVLIEKQKPDWQKGKWNAIGGKIEPSDPTPRYAMEREFWEETGVLGLIWAPLASVVAPYWRMWVFETFSSKIWGATTMEEERVHIHNIDNILRDPNLIDSLKFYIPLALEEGRGLVKPIELEYNSTY